MLPQHLSGRRINADKSRVTQKGDLPLALDRHDLRRTVTDRSRRHRPGRFTRFVAIREQAFLAFAAGINHDDAIDDQRRARKSPHRFRRARVGTDVARPADISASPPRDSSRRRFRRACKSGRPRTWGSIGGPLRLARRTTASDSDAPKSPRPVAASRQTTTSVSPRCSCVNKRSPITSIDDQAGPMRCRQTCFGGCDSQSVAIFKPCTSPRRFAPRNSVQSPGCATSVGILATVVELAAEAFALRLAKYRSSADRVQRQANAGF